MTPDEMKALIAEAREMSRGVVMREWDEASGKYVVGPTLVERLTDALEAVYDAGRRELAERFASQDATRRAAIEELIAWEDFRGATCAACGANFSASGGEAGDELEIEHVGDSLHRFRFRRHLVPTDEETEALNAGVVLAAIDDMLAPWTLHRGAHLSALKHRLRRLRKHVAEHVRPAPTDWEFEVVDGDGHWQSYVPDNDPSWFDPADWPDGYRLMRRRKVGPWSPVPTDGEGD